MDDKQLQRAIQSVGKGCFVKYYKQFKDASRSNEDLIDLLMKNEKYTETASATRVSKSRSIINAQRAKDVLIDITKSERLDDEVKAKARELLREL